jgi:hypothetical protein
MYKLRWSLLIFIISVVFVAPAAAADRGWKAGVAVQVITPSEPMWMAGYGARNKPAEGKLHDLFVKALALEDAGGNRLVLLTSDLVGIPRELAEDVCAEVSKRTGLKREQIMLTASHTHCGPVTRDALLLMYPMPDEEAKKIAPYTDKLRGWMVETIVAAVADLKPAKLSAGQGTARFAVNRRKPTPNGFVNDANPDGPVDHDVPVLRVEGAGGRTRAVVMGYACHNTTMQFYQWCGDYAGFAQRYVEEKHPGAVAMFTMGCGADANPLPRSKIELCEKYGHMLADAVNDVLAGRMTPVQPSSAARYQTIVLPFDTIPSKEKWVADAAGKNFAAKKRAEYYLKRLAEGKEIDREYRHYPVQAWRLGEEVEWVALGGEVVVDYSRRLKKELAADFKKDAGERYVWITAYANDVMAYIPSERVLKEGGYEGDTSMIAYGRPAKWAPGLEEKIVSTTKKLVREVMAKP